jgi:hypothetical protein
VQHQEVNHEFRTIQHSWLVGPYRRTRRRDGSWLAGAVHLHVTARGAAAPPRANGSKAADISRHVQAIRQGCLQLPIVVVERLQPRRRRTTAVGIGFCPMSSGITKRPSMGGGDSVGHPKSRATGLARRGPVQRYGSANERLEGSLVDFLPLVEVDSPPNVAFEARIEQS